MTNKHLIIDVQNISKKFKDKIANNNIAFKVYRGDKIGIIGENGAGKTTLVEQLVGISQPTNGKIVYYFRYKRSPQEKMGIQFQDSSYPEGLTVKDVIDFQLDIYGSKISRKRLEKLIDIFKIRKFYREKAKSLSGGQQQKINVLLAIIHDPEIVILDEISTGLDIAAKEEIFSYVKQILENKNMTTLLISHNMSEIERLCKRIIVLENGAITYDGTLKHILDEYESLNQFMFKKLLNKQPGNALKNVV